MVILIIKLTKFPKLSFEATVRYSNPVLKFALVFSTLKVSKSTVITLTIGHFRDLHYDHFLLRGVLVL